MQTELTTLSDNRDNSINNMEQWKKAIIMICSCCCLVWTAVEGTPIRERRDVSQLTGVSLIERPCPASVPLVLSDQSGPYVPPYTAARLENLKNDVKTMESTFSTRLGSPYIVNLFQTYPRDMLGVITRSMGTEDLGHARNSTRRAEVIAEIKRWLLVYTVYTEYIQRDERYLVDQLYLRQNDALLDKTAQIIQLVANIICEVHLTIHANGFSDDLAMYEPIKFIQHMDNTDSAKVYSRNYVIAYDFEKFIDFAIVFFVDWAQDVMK